MMNEGARFLLVTWDGSGNSFPELALVRGLGGRGHEVRVLGHQSQREWIEDTGARFLGYSRAPEFDAASPLPVPMEEEVAWSFRTVFFHHGFARDLLSELAREPTDALLVDYALFVALAGAEHSGMPTVALCHSLPGILAEGPFAEAFHEALPSLNAFRAELGLDELRSLQHQWARLRLMLAMTSELVDLPLPPFLGNVRYVGPFSDPPPDTGSFIDPWPADDTRPLVVVSFSTGFMGQEDAIQSVLDALEELPVRAFLTLGHYVDVASLRIPANVRAERFVPHDLVLPHASLVVTHSGHGTVMRALAHGVPLLCLPMGRDQYFVSGRVASLGLGRTVSVEASTEEIGREVLQILRDPKYREAAGGLAKTIDRDRGLARALDLVEGIVAPGQPEERSMP
jgi:MGT family glycosyltransferase